MSFSDEERPELIAALTVTFADALLDACTAPARTFIMRHETVHDHDAWIRLFAAAISGEVSRHPGASIEPATLAKTCGAIADAALKEERQRRCGK